MQRSPTRGSPRRRAATLPPASTRPRAVDTAGCCRQGPELITHDDRIGCLQGEVAALAPHGPSRSAIAGRGDAERLARAALSSASLDVSGATVEALGGITGWYIAVVPSVGGVPLATAPWSMAVGPHGAVLSASGWLAQAMSAGKYPLVGLAAGLERLRDGGWVLPLGPGPVPLGASGAFSGGGSAPTQVAPATPVVRPAPAPVLPPSPTTFPTHIGTLCPGVGGCAAPPTLSPPPPTIVIVTGVHLGLAWGTPASGGGAEVWLVPVYVFELHGGRTVPVLAVSDRFIDGPPTVQPLSGLPVPVPVPGTPVPASAAPARPSSTR